MLFGIPWDTTNDWLFASSILPILLRGMVVTLQATVVGFFVAAILGLVLAALKSSPSRLIAWPARLFTEFIRDTPLLVQLFFLYYVLPEYGIVLPAFRATGDTANYSSLRKLLGFHHERCPRIVGSICAGNA